MESSTLFAKLQAMRKQHRVASEAVVWITVWLVASPLVMMCIKTLMSSENLNFPFPWLLIGFSNFGTWAVCSLLQCMPGSLQEADSTVAVPWKMACVLGLLQGFQVGIGAELIHKMSITLRTEICMLGPVWMFVGAVFAGLEQLEPQIVLSVIGVTLGGVLASYGSMTSEGLALVPLFLLMALFETSRWVLTQKWLSSSGHEKPSPITLARRMSPMTALVGFVVAFAREPGCYQSLPMLPYPFKVTSLLCIISIGVCLMLVAEMRVVQLTSAVLLSFMYPVHNVIVILLDASVKGTKIAPLNCMGIVLCAVASGFYSNARLQNKDKEGVEQPVIGAQGCAAKGPCYQSADAAQPQLTSTEA